MKYKILIAGLVVFGSYAQANRDGDSRSGGGSNLPPSRSHHEDLFRRAQDERAVELEAAREACTEQQVQIAESFYQNMYRTRVIPIHRSRNIEIVSAEVPDGQWGRWYVETRSHGACEIRARLWPDDLMFPEIVCPRAGYRGWVGPIDMSVPGC